MTLGAKFLRKLLASLELVGFPDVEEGRRSYRAGNQVGDAVLLRGMVHGPLFDRLGGVA